MPETISASDFESEDYLKPVLADDALLLCLDDLPEQERAGVDDGGSAEEPSAGSSEATHLLARNAELQGQLERLAKQFDNYRLAAEQTLDRRWGDSGAEPQPGGAQAAAPAAAAAAPDGYFQSYGHNGASTVASVDVVLTAQTSTRQC